MTGHTTGHGRATEEPHPMHDPAPAALPPRLLKMARETDRARAITSRMRSGEFAAMRERVATLQQEHDRLVRELGLIRGSRAVQLALGVRRLSQRLRGRGDSAPWTPATGAGRPTAAS